MSRLCCPPSCCPGGVKGATAALAIAAAVATVAVVTHLLALFAVLGVLAASWVIAVAVVAVLARFTVHPPVLAAEPGPYRLTATVISEAVPAAQHPESAAPVPAIENHYHLHLYAAGEREAAAVLRSVIPGTGEAITRRES